MLHSVHTLIQGYSLPATTMYPVYNSPLLKQRLLVTLPRLGSIPVRVQPLAVLAGSAVAAVGSVAAAAVVQAW